jgi:diphthine-ammonia ligase
MTAAVLWTGGKDSAYALYASAALGMRELVTFVPKDAHFKAHDLDLMGWQARAIGLPHRRMLVEPPYEAGYERALAALRDEGIERVVTGDIAEVGGQPNFISARAARVGMKVELPVWGVDRREHLRQIVELGFDVVLTFVNEPWLDASWVGRHLDVPALQELSQLSLENGLDPAGENGEYHSMVLAGPGWRAALRLTGVTRSAPPQHRLEITRIVALPELAV